MIISHIGAGTGNRMYMYAAGRRLAHKLNTEFKLDVPANANRAHPYLLDQFNITATIATPDEIKKIKALSNGLGIENPEQKFMPEVLDYPDNVYLQGYWIDQRYFADITDIIRREFTLKNTLSPAAQYFKEKILTAECSVSMHFRHGDFFYSPRACNQNWRMLTLDYYQDCLNTLKHYYPNESISVFVISNNIQWCKENLRLDVPTYFIEGCAHDVEDLYLMSLCKHNILVGGSTFSRWGAWLNLNPDKKIFSSYPSTAEAVLQYRKSLTPRKFLDRTIGCEVLAVPFDYKNHPVVTMRPIFSLLLLVNNDAATIAETLDSILKQDYRYYEVIIIDNASTDGSNKICQDAVAGKENVIFKKLYSKVTNAEAWNIAFKMASGGGYYVSFLKANNRFLTTDTLSELYHRTTGWINIIHMFSVLEENENGNMNFGEKKYFVQRDAKFKDEKRNVIMSTDGSDAAKLLLDKQINSFLGTKVYNREFLLNNGIKFDESLADDEAELFFQMEAFLKSKYFMYISNAFYVVPKV